MASEGGKKEKRTRENRSEWFHFHAATEGGPGRSENAKVPMLGICLVF